MQNQDESGRSMIEMLGVLSIMGVIVYGAVAGINFGLDMYKLNATYREVDELAQSIVDLSSWTTDYSHLTAKRICDNDAYPTCSCTGGNCTLTNEWGGGVTVAKYGQFFQITYKQIPEAACERLRAETGFQHVCVKQNEITCGSSSTITFYARGSDKCNIPTP